MSIGLFDNVGKSFGFAIDNTFKKFLRWIGLAIVMCIPIVNFITTGIFLKIYRDEEPDFSNAGKAFIQGLLLWIIQIIYMIIPAIIIWFSLGGSAATALLADPASADAILGVGALIGLLIAVVVAVILGLVMQPAIVNFARTEKFGSAFAFGDLFGMIGKVGWGKYILAWIVLILVAFVIGIVLGCVAWIPILGWIIGILAMPFLTIFNNKYFANLFE